MHPSVVCALGASAAKALYGSGYRVSHQRGEVVADDGIRWTAAVHPSSILRGPDEVRAAARQAFTDDLRRIGELLG